MSVTVTLTDAQAKMLDRMLRLERTSGALTDAGPDQWWSAQDASTVCRAHDALRKAMGLPPLMDDAA